MIIKCWAVVEEKTNFIADLYRTKESATRNLKYYTSMKNPVVIELTYFNNQW